MHAESGASRLPRRVRRGLLVAVALSAAGLLGALPDVVGGAATGEGAASGEGAAPYGVEGCAAAAGAVPVDVVVTASALAADGSSAETLGGSGLEVGASVRDLDGYAARGVAPCDVVQVSVHLHDPAGGGSTPATLQRAPAPLDVTGDGDDGGRLVAVDWSTWAASLPQSARGGELHEQAAWLVTLVDPQPGTYRLTGRVTAAAAGGASGEVEVLVTLAGAAGGV